jgi:hypothetical protein
VTRDRHLAAAPRTSLLVAASLFATGLLAGCTGSDDGDTPASSPTTETSAGFTATPKPAKVRPRPDERACYRLGYQQALSPTTKVKPVPCDSPHTAFTFDVGTLDSVVDGHLLAVDSRHVQDWVAAHCPELFDSFVGGTLQDRRLSMLRAVWFTPTVKQSDRGADWYRCDMIALSGEETLARLNGQMAGVLDTPEGRTQYGMCGTADPGSDDFQRVVCSRRHSWRAISTFTFDGTDYPGEESVRSEGETACEAAGRGVAADTLNFQWGYEWPTEKQWNAGHTYGLCWAPG